MVIPFGLEQHDVQHDPQRVAHWRETVGDNFFLFVGAFRYYKGCTFCWMPPSVAGCRW